LPSSWFAATFIGRDFVPAIAGIAINAADLSGRITDRMAECGHGNVIAQPASGSSYRDELT
jgi:hypothetical protein